MSEKRITKRDLFTRLFEVVADSDLPDGEMLCDFIAHEIALIDKKRNAPRVPTETQLENEALKQDILTDLDVNGGSRAGEIAGRLGKSNQKVSALLRQLVLAGNVKRMEDKKVVTFVRTS